LAASPDQLIVLDYSGTLSLEAPLFAGPDSLMDELALSGLQNFGIDRPHVFWEKLVNPTWQEGSTTPAGYKRVLSDRIIAVLQPDLPMQQRKALDAAVGVFVDRYLKRSRIDPRWEPILRRIRGTSSVVTVIATDHYAEATDAIIHFLAEWMIGAVSLADAASGSQGAAFVVANSADMGCRKDDPRFWQTLKTSLRLDALRHILLIDDFGCNEQEGDAYREPQTVENRMHKTINTIESVFSVAVDALPAMIRTADVPLVDRFEHLVGQAESCIDRFLAIGRIERQARPSA
jgi:hypothetical protein